MTDIPFDEPRGKPSAKVHHLTHLVSAITTQLSACLSLNSFLNQCLSHINDSNHTADRAEDYHTSLNLSRKSLETFAHHITRQLSISSGADSTFEPGVEGHSLKEGGYDSVKAAARECVKIPALLQSIQDHQEELDYMHEGQQWQGWPKCNALDDLKDLNEVLLALRDSGGNSDVGWGVAWKLLVDADV
ncbi:hypothetical protein MBLNU13_g05341t2 [Cladosporium sp. NU13]